MPAKRQFAPGEIEAQDVKAGRLEPHYLKTLGRLLAAHALAEKLTAAGYARVLKTVENAALLPTIEKNLAEERKHARMVYGLLEELGIDEVHADRSMIAAAKSASFEAPRHFAQQACGELDLVMASVSLDMTGFLMIGVNYRESSYAPHARAAEAILVEEADHELFAAGELIEVADRLGAEPVNSALRQWLPRAANFFGPPGSGFTYDCMRYGLKSRDNGELRELYLSMLERKLSQAGLKMPRLSADYPHSVG